MLLHSLQPVIAGPIATSLSTDTLLSSFYKVIHHHGFQIQIVLSHFEHREAKIHPFSNRALTK